MCVAFSVSVVSLVFVNDFSAAEKVLCRDPSLVNPTKQDTATPLHVAAAGGHVDVAKVLIKVGINLILIYILYIHYSTWKNFVKHLFFAKVYIEPG